MKIKFISCKLELQTFRDNTYDILNMCDDVRSGKFVHSYVIFNNITEAKKYEKKRISAAV
jgi:hypothetical protein